MTLLRQHLQVRPAALDPFRNKKNELVYASSAMLTLGPVVTGWLSANRVEGTAVPQRTGGCSSVVILEGQPQRVWDDFLAFANPSAEAGSFTGAPTFCDVSRGWTPIAIVKQKAVKKQFDWT